MESHITTEKLNFLHENFNDFETEISQIISILEKKKIAVLSTSKKGIIDSCQMTYVSNGLDIFMQTDDRFEKITNIKSNENVSVVVGSLTIQGKAVLFGKPNKSDLFVEKIKSKCYKTYENYTNLPHQILIKITPVRCKLWKFENIGGQREEIIKIVDIPNKKIDVIVCDRLKSEYELIR